MNGAETLVQRTAQLLDTLVQRRSPDLPKLGHLLQSSRWSWPRSISTAVQQRTAKLKHVAENGLHPPR